MCDTKENCSCNCQDVDLFGSSVEAVDYGPVTETFVKPKVGQIVLFYTTDEGKHFNGCGVGPYSAIVTQVFNTNPSYSTMANLKVLHYGGMYDEGSVSLKEQGILNGDNTRWYTLT
jgi:hypothetical protein